MMLSQLVLDPMSRDVGRALGDPQRMHAILLGAFDRVEAAARKTHGLLYRVDHSDDAVTIYVQSQSAPVWERLQLDGVRDVRAPKNLDDVLGTLRAGDALHFRLRANVTRKIETKSDAWGARRNGRRVPLRDDAQAIAWLVRKGQQHGFALMMDPFGEPEVRLRREAIAHARRAGQTLTFEGVRFDGRMRVSDPEALRGAIAHGLGPAKAYGFGLLSVARG